MSEQIFSTEDYSMKVDWESWEKSQFDRQLENTWYSKENLFRYKLNIDKSKMLDGEFGFLAQLNINRAVNRRLPEDIRSLKQPFSEEAFNFTKVKKDEIMFSLNKNTSEHNDIERDFFLINVSPMEQCHSLLVPSLNKCLPQVLNEQSICTALHTLLLSSSPELRVGFNGLCAYATVNHLHLHVYYLSYSMKLETIKVSHLAGRCYTLENFPSKGYVFELTSPSDISAIAKCIHQLTSYLTNEDIAHNLFFTRGLSFEKSSLGMETSERDCIRIYVWARTSSFGAKVLDEFNTALCELFGHLIVKNKEAFEMLNEKAVAEILASITEGPFRNTKERVREMYS